MSQRRMKVAGFHFGSIRIDGETYEHDVVLRRGSVRKRDKKRSKRFKRRLGHTPLSLKEEIPWDCKRLVVGTGAYGHLPVMSEVEEEARHRGVELVVVPTAQAIALLEKSDERTNAVLHVTC
jgi:hypothetical protein